MAGPYPPPAYPAQMPMIPPYNIMMPPLGENPVISRPPQLAERAEGTTLNQWTEHKAPDGRIYYYNSETKQSLWEKPDDLKTPAERLLAQCPWKEHKTPEGKVYYYNNATKTSIWTKPEELETVEQRAAALSKDSTKSEIPLPLPMPVEKSETKSDMDRVMEATLQSYKAKENKSDGPIEFSNKKEAVDAFKELLKEKNVPSKLNWDQAERLIRGDARYTAIVKYSINFKQAFNAYRTQKARDEKEDERQRTKEAKEQLERFLLETPEINSHFSYRLTDKRLCHHNVWRDVPDEVRRELYADIMKIRAKNEKEAKKVLKKRNIKVLAQILDNMNQVNFKTTWTEAQQMLLDNEIFMADKDLQNMDKMDALICFEDHIRKLEEEHAGDLEREHNQERRRWRKNREGFLVLLDELHDQGKLDSESLWSKLFLIISQDKRFDSMLGQPGSTPLDLFKFYVEDLKARYHDEKRLIKEVMKERCFNVETNTRFDQFEQALGADERIKSVDPGNLRLAFRSLVEKAEAREKERLKEEARRVRKCEVQFKTMLKDAPDPPITVSDTWAKIRDRFVDDEGFKVITLEADRQRLFDEFLRNLEEACSHQHHHHSKKKKKKDKDKDRDKDKKAAKPAHRPSCSPSSSPDSVSTDRRDDDSASISRKHKKRKREKKDRHGDDESEGASQ